MVPGIRNILGGFLFSGDDIYKRAGVLSGGERTRLAVARMLLRPANTLVLDEPTNHLDLDSKDVLLDALEDFGGTLIFVSHDRYFVDKLATKIVSVGQGGLEVYPGGYEEFLWSRTARATAPPPEAKTPAARGNSSTPRPARTGTPDPGPKPAASYAEKKKEDAESRRRQKAADERGRRIQDLEQRIAEREEAIRQLEAQMSAPGFYDVRETAEPIITRHQALMWEVGDLMNQWEGLQTAREDPK
jgi:ATP-binding cassette subfamily F protein 3